MDPHVIRGKRPTPEQEATDKAAAEHWHKIVNEAPVQAISRVEDAAKQVVTLTGTLQGLYLAIFAFSDLRQRLPNPYLQLMFVIPLVLWLGSLSCATQVFVPRVRSGADLADASPAAWEHIRDTYDATGRQKLRWPPHLLRDLGRNARSTRTSRQTDTAAALVAHIAECSANHSWADG